ncbi:1-deoxy-D-xylulose-5-phosphate reductoisomerase [Desulfovibrio inopinatus]|uniref:1-deoxy-D-xylulose-5-phosphate reductoisomerase n=1 Tax=Desulfovibrio inopinatus TaxID=102109 RepID=UPI0004078157|nr:1-deoxy-D-xylulose-5-phosphate reductoisomerase [Desulfovibrio inopinatus]
MSLYISSLPSADTLPDFPRNLVILGATGSIGKSTLSVAAEHPEQYHILALAGARNISCLAQQAEQFRPEYLAVLTEEGAKELKSLLPAGYNPHILVGEQAYIELATLPDADVILSSIVGAAGLPPTLAAAKAGKLIALANKESLVLAGDLIRTTCRENNAVLLPVDSEHNALFQSLTGHEENDVTRLILTASGGPFREKDAEFLQTVTPAQALKHPNWSMGAKISIDSATLMNKGLEVIEACHLYGLSVERVHVVVHPQSMVHSLVEYHDTSLLAHLGPADMRVAISYCLGYPKRLPLSLTPIDLTEIGSLTFEKPRLDVFPCLQLAFDAIKSGPSHPVVLNAANEIAVERFLQEDIAFLDIPRCIEKALSHHSGCDVSSLDAIIELDKRTRQEVTKY